MITENEYPIFPACPSYGFSSQPDYLVKITSRESGRERRDRKWAEPRHRYEGTPLGPRPDEDIQQILEFWHAMGGNHSQFMFLDYADYKSCRVGREPAQDDQGFVAIDATHFQLAKQYAFGGKTTTRTIRHPIGSTLLVQNNLGVLQDASKWTIDENTGILTKGGSFTGTPGGWGGEFYVPVRFDGPFRTEIVDKKIHSLSVSMIELRPEDDQ